MTRDFGPIRSAIHSGGMLPGDWREDPTIRRYVLDCLSHSEPQIIRRLGADDLWLDAKAITVGPITYTGERLEGLRQWLASWAIEDAVRQYWLPAYPEDDRPLVAALARREWARGVMNGDEWDAARAAARAAAWDAAWAAAGDAARAAAWDAAWDAAWAAAWATIHTQAVARLTTLAYEHALNDTHTAQETP